MTFTAGDLRLRRLPNSVDTLAPTNRFVKAINTIPMAKGIPYHSIMGDRGRGDTPNSSDGVVPYWSSHLDGAESEIDRPVESQCASESTSHPGSAPNSKTSHPFRPHKQGQSLKPVARALRTLRLRLVFRESFEEQASGRVAGGRILPRDEPSGTLCMGLEVGSAFELRSQFAKASLKKERNLILQFDSAFLGVRKSRHWLASNQKNPRRIDRCHESSRRVTHGSDRFAGSIEVSQQTHELGIVWKIEHGAMSAGKEDGVEIRGFNARERKRTSKLFRRFLPASCFVTFGLGPWIDWSGPTAR